MVEARSFGRHVASPRPGRRTGSHPGPPAELSNLSQAKAPGLARNVGQRRKYRAACHGSACPSRFDGARRGSSASIKRPRRPKAVGRPRSCLPSTTSVDTQVANRWPCHAPHLLRGHRPLSYGTAERYRDIGPHTERPFLAPAMTGARIVERFRNAPIECLARTEAFSSRSHKQGRCVRTTYPLCQRPDQRPRGFRARVRTVPEHPAFLMDRREDRGPAISHPWGTALGVPRTR